MTKKVMKDSVDKIVTTYYSAVTKRSFVYDGREYEPKPLVVSPFLLRGYTCPSNCGACCNAYTLDYLPSEIDRYLKQLNNDVSDLGISETGWNNPRVIRFDGRKVKVFSDLNDDMGENRCRYVRTTDGRCEIHGYHAFSCDFELIRVLQITNKDRTESIGVSGPHNVLTQKLYGRGWVMERVDGERGAKCEMLPPDDHSVSEVLRKMERLQEWCTYFGLPPDETWIGEVCDVIRRGKLTKDVVLTV